MLDVARSPALLTALVDLDRADGKALIKGALKELVAADAWRVERQRAGGWWQRSTGGEQPVLVRGSGAVPAARLHALVAGHVEGARERPGARGPVRPLRDVAKHLARQRDVRRTAVRLALEDLVSAGLVEVQVRGRVRALQRRRHVRTPAGEALVPKRNAGEGLWLDGGAPGWGGDDDRRLDGDLDASFDSSFDASFDSAFDSGFSDGGGDGGGGDGGGD